MDTAAVNIDQFLSDEDISDLKNYAFKNGITLFYCSPIFGVKIRDKYFQEENIKI
jgi:hypothetical protein